MSEDAGKPTRRERKRLETQQKLINSALELLSELTYDEVTVEMITEGAGVAKGTFFSHFTNKEGVLIAYFDDQLALLQSALHGDVLQEFAGSNSPAMQICSLLQLLAKRDSTSRQLARTVCALTLTNEELHQASRRVQEEAIRVGLPLIREAQKAGELSDQVPADEMARLIAECYFMALRSWAEQDAPTHIADHLCRIFGWLFHGIGGTKGFQPQFKLNETSEK